MMRHSAACLCPSCKQQWAGALRVHTAERLRQEAMLAPVAPPTPIPVAPIEHGPGTVFVPVALNAASVGRRIRECRLQRKLTQGQVQALCGINQTYISSLEAGRFRPGLVLLERIVRALGMTSADFFAKGMLVTNPKAQAEGTAL